MLNSSRNVFQMEARNLVQRGNTLHVQFVITNYNNSFSTKCSPEFIISGLAVFQMKIIAAQIHNGISSVYNNLVLIKFIKRREDDETTYKIKVSSNELGIINKSFLSDDGTWHLIADNKKQQYTIDISIIMEIMPNAGSFASLHDDTDLTDIELRGKDGSVHLHKAVLAASSPVLRRMLGGPWKETAEGHVTVSETTKETLQHLKDYLYLNTLPDDGLEQLLLLASCYIMPALEQKCIDKLVNNLTAANACEVLEFAALNKMTKLILAILECVQNGGVRVEDMRVHCLENA